MKNCYPSEVRVKQRGPKAYEAECYAIRDSYSVLVAEGAGRSEDEAIEDCVAWMTWVGHQAENYWQIEAEYHQAPLLGRRYGVLLVACVCLLSLGCVTFQPQVRVAPAAPMALETPEASLEEIRESMKILSNPGNKELIRQFKVLQGLKDPCGVPKALFIRLTRDDVCPLRDAAQAYLDTFTGEEEYQAVKDYPMVGVSEDYLLSLIVR